jgi:glycosyltransferase involved in cell wall biosynthesis
MRIWLINSAEPTPLDQDKFRLRRIGILAQLAANQGHDVVWWNSTFLHATKRQRFDSDRTLELGRNYRIHFIHVPPYRKNVSLSRIRNHILLGRRFARWARRETPPDVILASLPTLELGDAAVRYGREHRVPTVLDVRDLWPDAMLDLVPSWSRAAGRFALVPYYRMARRACAGATAICGNTDEFVSWGLRCGRRRPTSLDQSFPFGYAPLSLSNEEAAGVDRFWHAQGVDVDPDVPVVCFFGSINYQFDFDTVLEAVRQVQAVRRVQFIFCGEGESTARYRQATLDNPDILFPGWVNAQQIWSLMARSSFGLAPYVENQGFVNSLSNKPVEYLAGGLPILCSLSQGPLFDLVTQERCGITYGGSADKLSRGILETLAVPGRHVTLVENARRIFAQKYDAAHVYGRMLAYLAALAAGQSASYHLAPAA